MSRCVICDEEIRSWRQTRIADGCICRNCSAKVPSIIGPQLSGMSTTSVQRLIQYEESPLFKRFSATASYGAVLLDEMNGLFAINEKLTSDIKLENTSNIFHVLDLTEIGIYCVKPRIYRNSVAIDVELQFAINSLQFKYKSVIRSQVFCACKKVDSTHVSWAEPGDLSMFRNMFNQCIKNEEIKLKRKYEKSFMSKEELSIFQAKCLFMIEDDFSRSELRQQKDALSRAFDSAVSSDVYMKKINEAYSILLPLAID